MYITAYILCINNVSTIRFPSTSLILFISRMKIIFNALYIMLHINKLYI